MKEAIIISTILGLILFAALEVMAEPQQAIENNQSYFTANLQKQPEKDNKQKIQNHFTFFTINVQINGKIKDIADSEQK
jgi:uncharacterized protein YsxB (DUF464 family)